MSNPLVHPVRAALAAARTNRDGDRTLLLSTLLSESGNRAIALGQALSDEALDVVVSRIARRREAADAEGRLIHRIVREDLAARA